MSDPTIVSLAEKARDALAELAIAADQSGDFSASREVLTTSGLLALRVPTDFGGAGGSQQDVLGVFRILAQADGGVSQLLQPHYGFTDAVVMLGSDSARERVYADLVAGGRIANAASERGGRHGADFVTVYTPQEDGSFLLSGRKYYATGSIGAAWITVMAPDTNGVIRMAFIPADANGVSISDDWNGIGQRGSASGSLELDRVHVPADFIFEWSPATRPKAWAEAGRLAHAAIDQGIAEGALAYGLASVKATNRVPFELAAYASLSEDPILKNQIGKAAAQVRAGNALLAQTGALLDAAEALASDPDALLPELRAALAATKAYTADVSNQTASEIFAWTGARTADASLRADRFWRNARTHTLHDPVRLRYADLGGFELEQA